MKKAIIFGLVMLFCISSAMATVQTTDVVAYYKFNDNANDEKNDLNGNATGIQYHLNGLEDKLAWFEGDGSGDIIAIGGDTDSSFTTDDSFSIGGWIKTNTTYVNGNHLISNSRVNGITNNYLYMFITGGNLKFRMEDDDGNKNADSTTVWNNGEWQFFVATYDGTNKVMKLFKNDTFDVGIVTGFTAGQTLTTGKWYIGDTDNSGMLNRNWEGAIDELAIYNRNLTNTEITELYNSGAGLFYPFTGSPQFNENNVTLTLKNKGDNSTVKNFTANLQNGTVNWTFTTTSGSIITNITLNSTQRFNITFYNVKHDKRTFNNKTILNSDFTNSTYSKTYYATPHTLITANSLSGTSLDNFTIGFNNRLYTTTNGSVYIDIWNGTYTFNITDIVSGSGYARDEATLITNPYRLHYNFTLYVTNTFNLLFYDEQTNALIRENVSIEINIYGTTDGNTTNNTITNYTELYTLLVPDMYRINYIVDGYEENNYYQLLTNQSFNNLSLYSMPTNASPAELRITVKETETYDDFANVIVVMQRLYISNGVWKTVQMDKSGEFGEGFFDIIEKTEDYRFIFLNLSNTLLEQTEDMKFSCDSGICDVTFVVSSLGVQIVTQDLVVVSSIRNQTENGTITWSDPVGASHSVNVKVTQHTVTGDITIADVTQIGASGTIPVNLSAYTGEVQVLVTVDGEPQLGFNEKISQPMIPSIIGEEEGILWSFGIAVTVAMMGLFSAVGAIIFMIVGLIIALFLGFSSVLSVTFIILACIIGVAIGLRIKQR